MRDPGELFIQAPTGTGKTMAIVFATLEALEQGDASRIFYLTAKTTTQSIAEQALSVLRASGMRLESGYQFRGCSQRQVE